jgi:PilZ domain
MSTGFTIRSYRRFPIQWAVEYRSPECVGKGIVRNVSRSGWRVEGDHVITPGTVLILAMSFPCDTIPLRVEKAIVRWVKPGAFGIRIIEMQPVHAARLRRIVTLLEQQSLCPPDSPPFPPRWRADPPARKS